jgi:hypothetical protein
MHLNKIKLGSAEKISGAVHRARDEVLELSGVAKTCRK